MNRARKILATMLLVVASVVGFGVVTAQPAAAYTEYQYPNGPLYRDWGWLNSKSGGIHVYMYDYCAISLSYFGSGPNWDKGCRQLVVDEDIWGYGVYNALNITLPYWTWPSQIVSGVPYAAPAVIVFEGGPTGPWEPWNNLKWTTSDEDSSWNPNCMTTRRWCGLAANGMLWYHNYGDGVYPFSYSGNTSHNNWLAQFRNQYFGGGQYRALIYFGVV